MACLSESSQGPSKAAVLLPDLEEARELARRAGVTEQEFRLACVDTGFPASCLLRVWERRITGSQSSEYFICPNGALTADFDDAAQEHHEQGFRHGEYFPKGTLPKESKGATSPMLH